MGGRSCGHAASQSTIPPWLSSQYPAVTCPPQPIPTSLSRPTGYIRAVTVHMTGSPFSWAVEVPLDHGQLRQLILQSHEKEWGNATGTGKKGRNGVKV